MSNQSIKELELKSKNRALRAIKVCLQIKY